jgi:hypothetical protein
MYRSFGKKESFRYLPDFDLNAPLVVTVMVVATFDVRLSFGFAAAITLLMLITDTIFSVIVTYIFLKPMLEVLKWEKVHTTVVHKRLERTKRWNLAGVLVTVGSSTALYLNCFANFTLTFLGQFSLSRSVFGNPFVFGGPVDSILNTLGMILLCGMFKDRSSAPSSNIRVEAAPGESPQVESGFVLDSHVDV